MLSPAHFLSGNKHRRYNGIKDLGAMKNVNSGGIMVNNWFKQIVLSSVFSTVTFIFFSFCVPGLRFTSVVHTCQFFAGTCDWCLSSLAQLAKNIRTELGHLFFGVFVCVCLIRGAVSICWGNKQYLSILFLTHFHLFSFLFSLTWCRSDYKEL